MKIPIGGALIVAALSTVVSDVDRSATAATDGLVAYYPLNDGVAVDVSGLQNHGVPVGVQPTEDRNRNLDSAFFFDGTVSRIELPTDLMEPADWEDGFSVSWWQEAALTTGLRAVWRLEEDKWIQAFYNESQFGEGLCVALLNEGAWNSVCDSAPPQRWTHYAFTYDGRVLQLFRDSALLSTAESPGIQDNSFVNRISGVSQLPNADFVGRIDEFRVYDRPLSDAEVEALFVGSLLCIGFFPPINAGPVTVRGNRALPLKAELMDDSGSLVGDDRVSALPTLEVRYDPVGSDEAVDVTDLAFPSGAGTDGNHFVFEDGLWRFNLKTRNFAAPGTYTVAITSGDESEYRLESCSVRFVIDP